MKIFPGDLTDQLTNRLVAYYKLEDVLDFYGANNLTNNGVVTFIPGKILKAAKFDGIAQSLTVFPTLSTDTTFISFFMWVFIPTASEQGAFFENNVGGTGYMLGVGNTQLLNPGNKLILYLPGVAWEVFSAIGTGWHHVGVTRDSSTWKAYIDGIQCVTTYVHNPVAVGAATTKIGGEPAFFWKDKVDELCFWRRTLTPAEITFLYNAGAGLTLTDTNLTPTVPTTAIGFSSSINHSSYYGGALRTFDVVFPTRTLTILAEVFDRNASGMDFQKGAENAFYQILSGNQIRIRFHGEMRGQPAGVWSDAHGLQFAYPANWPEAGPTDHSDAYACAIGDGKNYFQHYYFTMDLTVDISTLGIIPKKHKHHGGELWGIVPEIANYIG